MFLFGLILFLAALYLFTKLKISAPDLSQYDKPVGDHFDKHENDAEYTEAFLKVIRGVRGELKSSKSLKKSIKIARDFADNLSADWDTDSEFKSVNANGVSCEWVIPTNVNNKRRMLFLHGGAFLLGSPKGHRKLTDQLAKATQSAVLSVDYRLLPENNRGASIEDAQSAYRWILANSPLESSDDFDTLLLAGDSAGGNLALMLSGWSKTAKLRRPDAVIALSPSTDMTLSSPSMLANSKSDPVLGEGLAPLAKIPSLLRSWLSVITTRSNPANPLASPLLMDLSDLPPTLIQASSNEMLLDDAVRYTNKARVSGSDVTLQIWENQVHDWQLFTAGSGSANESFDEISKFLVSIGIK